MEDIKNTILIEVDPSDSEKAKMLLDKSGIDFGECYWHYYIFILPEHPDYYDIWNDIMVLFEDNNIKIL